MRFDRIASSCVCVFDVCACVVNVCVHRGAGRAIPWHGGDLFAVFIARQRRSRVRLCLRLSNRLCSWLGAISVYRFGFCCVVFMVLSYLFEKCPAIISFYIT